MQYIEHEFDQTLAADSQRPTTGGATLGARVDDLALAIAATRHGPGPARMSSWVRRNGVDAFTANFDRLDSGTARSVFDEAAEMADQGVVAIKLGDADYPPRLSSNSRPPAVLFCSGPAHLLNDIGIGICGSRKAGNLGLEAAASSGQISARLGMITISGYAKGVDTAAHGAALNSGGTTVLVLPEGIKNFRVRPGEFADSWDPDRAVIVSQFSPAQPWRAGNAMARNATIIGLSAALVVVEAGETGGTLAAGRTALGQDRRVLVLDFTDRTPGNIVLLESGAIAVHDQNELAELLDHLMTSAEPAVHRNGTAAASLF